jgi:hypothetical protein
VFSYFNLYRKPALEKYCYQINTYAMKDFKDNNDRISRAEDEVKAGHADQNSKNRKVDAGFKTGDKKYVKQEWSEPLDEQQFDDTSLNEGSE